MMIKKIVLFLLVAMVIVLTVIVVLLQLQAGEYLDKVNKDYSLFSDKQELNNTPFVFYYVSSKLFPDEYRIYKINFHLPYCEHELEHSYFISPGYGAYYLYRYYSIEEIKSSNCYSKGS